MGQKQRAGAMTGPQRESGMGRDAASCQLRSPGASCPVRSTYSV